MQSLHLTTECRYRRWRQASKEVMFLLFVNGHCLVASVVAIAGDNGEFNKRFLTSAFRY